MTRIDPERAAELYAEHRSIHRVAAMLGATGEGVRQCLIRRGIRVQTREAALKALHADPEFKARHAERMKALNADHEFKARHAERMKALHADPEFKARKRAGIQRHHFGVEIPAWVPTDLRHYYARVALAYGEEKAMSHLRDTIAREAAL